MRHNTGQSENHSLLSIERFQTRPVDAQYMWRQHPEENPTPNEVFADMFLGWVYGELPDNVAGLERQEYMDAHIHDWLEETASGE